ncbi:helix-turn-helix transcriptional regulator [Streptomyces althioticus]|uniref:Helix-turn-helix transcriptional regulator n=1 Tax=Streptomyces althioticus TaxID=83380 RepID=A0ABZ1Y4B8_9ACTN|nr:MULTISPECIES: helix-turn-helix transcriptional regulator [unclassified Streptomyces]MDN3286673.1 helix-turn-helix transcriptional regulator [Streptomyces thermocarboxydus]WTB94092.1 helix-turn-helix transcriptional regulator [Streptomyces althioticus]GHE61947.1 transcriptional regulator [Streptomyces cellulosae]AZM60717.1 XRE family transcriptional regulator [Streptomyces sp. WAC 01438]KOU02636.1 transcriptional regulator [Streptomyces sp. NRRL F-4711]
MALKRKLVPQSVYRRQLATRLRELREASGLTLTEVSEQIEVNQGSLSRIETGERGTTPVLVRALLDCYAVTDTELRDDILDLVRADKEQQKPWWRKYSTVLTPTRYDGYLALEAGAVALANYQPLLVPGLLQTEDYARAVIAQMRPDLGADQVDALVKVRMERQESCLSGERPAELRAVLDEAVLHRVIGSPTVMRQQFARLVQAGEQPNVTIQLLPFTLGAHPGLYGPFVILTFPQPTGPLVWLENPNNSVYLESQSDVQNYTDTFDQLRASALSPAETLTRLIRTAEELEP